MEKIRKAYDKLKDSTKVGLAKVKSEFKVCNIHMKNICFQNTHIKNNIKAKLNQCAFLDEWSFISCFQLKDLDIAIVKATNHVESPPKERHIASESIETFLSKVIYIIQDLLFMLF